MKKIPFLLIVAALACSFTFGQIKYSTYNNERFGFSIDYPGSLLKMQPGPENDDGRTFISSDGSLEMRVWGQYNVLSETLKQKYDAALRNFPERPSYTVLGAQRYVVSGVKNGKVEYVKTLYQKEKETDTYYTLTIEYPVELKTRWDTIVTHIANSFSITQGAAN